MPKCSIDSEVVDPALAAIVGQDDRDHQFTPVMPAEDGLAPARYLVADGLTTISAGWLEST